ncbi:MAG: ketoacyl-ACP synthase III [Kiritimatiellae bacterium]|nr:ketoacyl-ACP synthase III [Kiritimatiellia bacterium]
MGTRILGTGSYLPPKTVANGDLAKALDTSDEWIFSHTGIHSRHVAEEGETTSTMAAKAARSAMEAAGVSPEEIGFIVLATSTPDYATFPSTACLVQGILGCANAGAFDLQAACAGFVYALEMARGWLKLNPGRKALAIGAECLTRILDWTDRSSCILFGDGAGAVVLGDDGQGDGEGPKARTILGADGSGRHFIQRTGGTMASLPLDPETGIPQAPKPFLPHLSLMGHEVFAFAVKTMSRITEELCALYDEKPAALDRVFAHQANGRIIEACARRMKLPLGKFWLNLQETANTSAASIPISLDQAVRAGELKDGMKVVLVGFGAGLSFGGTYMTWPAL